VSEEKINRKKKHTHNKKNFVFFEKKENDERKSKNNKTNCAHENTAN